jgi:flagellin-like hook-associated protein FlgL
MQMADVNLSKAVRQNLLSLQSTATNMAKTQNRLATGLKVNSALDNPSNFFTASALNSRAGDMANLLDSMASGIQTIEAADNGLKSITKTVESMQSTLRQARQDKSFKTESYTMTSADVTALETNASAAVASAKQLTVSGGAFAEGTSASIGLIGGATASTELGAVDATFDLDVAADGVDFSISTNGATATAVTIRGGAPGANTITVDAGATAFTLDVADGSAVTQDELVEAINGGFAAVDLDITASINDDGNLVFTAAKTDDLAAADVTVSAVATAGTGPAIGDFGFSGASPTQTETIDWEAKTVDQLVSQINASTSDFAGKVRASNDNGKLRLENQSTAALDVTGVSATGAVDGVSTASSEIGGNDVRKNLVKQFNELRDQLDKFADDASFNGINLLRGDKLKLTFNETGTSTIEIQAKDAAGAETSINNTSLGITNAVDADFDSDAGLDARLDALKSSLDTLRSQSSTFGSNLSVVENRQDFTKNMINTLETGAANLTLADSNEEAANLLALQTRQQLSSTALSMASQADQAVLRLF